MNGFINRQMQNILHSINEGVHIVNKEGYTIFYNNAMEQIEGLNKSDVIGKHLLNIYPNWKKENSTLLTVLQRKKAIKEKKQTYINVKGKKITTINTTIPLFENNELIGAAEIASNYTDVSQMSEKIITLQEQLNSPKKTKSQKLKPGIHTFDDMIGQSEKFKRAVKLAKRAAKSKSSVLIYGDTGTGKELIAQSIHSASDRKNKPFIGQNCAALPASLLEGILFGTTKGSFTGAENRQGLFEQANGGTLFLDEINSMSMDLQAKLLRVLQENYVRRIGGQKDIPIDVRIIAATNQNHDKLIQNNQMRRDLFYRINVIGIKLPRLEERTEDIPLLTEHFINEFNEEFDKDVWLTSEKVLEYFKKYSWEGNVRELRNYIESAMNIIDDDHVIKVEHLPIHFMEKMDLINNKNKELNKFEDFDNLPNYIEDIEKETINDIFLENEKNVTQTAKALGISRQSLQYKLKKYNL